MKTSEKGKELIKSFEKIRLKPYKCLPSEIYYTIGYGHCGKDVTPDMTITREEANNLLNNDIVKCEKCVNTYMNIYNFNQNQYDALVSFTYNCGASNLNRLVNLGRRSIKEISEKILLYNKSGGKVITGLVIRRNKEKELFDTPYIINETQLSFPFNNVKICLNISKRHPVSNKNLPVVSLDFSTVTFFTVETIILYGTGNIDVYNGESYELCLVECKETKTVSLQYIRCDLIKG